MKQATIRWGVPLFALLVLGPLAWLPIGTLEASDGTQSVTLLLSASPVQGLLGLLLTMILAVLIGGLGARLFGGPAGLFSAGLVLAWAARATGEMDDVIRRTASSSAMWTLALEALIVVGFALAVAAVILRLGAGRGHATRDAGEPLPVLNPASGAALLIAAAVAAVVVWLVARESLKGQVFAAAAAAAVFGVAAARAGVARAPVLAFFGAFALLAVVSPCAAVMLHGGGEGLAEAANLHTLFPLARLTPLDWVAGAFVGAPIGLAWAASLVEKDAPAP